MMKIPRGGDEGVAESEGADAEVAQHASSKGIVSVEERSLNRRGGQMNRISTNPCY